MTRWKWSKFADFDTIKHMKIFRSTVHLHRNSTNMWWNSNVKRSFWWKVRQACLIRKSPNNNLINKQFTSNIIDDSPELTTVNYINRRCAVGGSITSINVKANSSRTLNQTESESHKLDNLTFIVRGKKFK